jgi:uncharacterized Zn finger protein (UPF0148 family)
MPPDAYFHCPACGAKLRLGQRSKPRVGCPRCGYVFDYEQTQADETDAESNVDPFVSSPQSEGSAEEIIDPFAETEASENSPDEAGERAALVAARKPAAAPRRSAKGDVRPTTPVAQTFVPRVAPPEIEPGQKTGKKKKKGSRAAFRVTPGMYAVGVALGIVLILLFVRFVVFGNRLTMNDIAGTYICDKDADIKVTLYADGTCAVEDASNGNDLNVGDMEYTFDGRKIRLKSSSEMKRLNLSPAQLIFFLARGPSRIDEAAHKFSDLTFEDGTLYSRSKGRFTREGEGKEEG